MPVSFSLPEAARYLGYASAKDLPVMTIRICHHAKSSSAPDCSSLLMTIIFLSYILPMDISTTICQHHSTCFNVKRGTVLMCSMNNAGMGSWGAAKDLAHGIVSADMDTNYFEIVRCIKAGFSFYGERKAGLQLLIVSPLYRESIEQLSRHPICI